MAERKQKIVINEDPFTEPVCNNCKNYIKGTITCKAFAQRIPDDILDGVNPHAIPTPGQKNTIVFQAKN